MKNRKNKLAAVAGLFALACVVVSGCGGRTKPSTPEEKRFAESARVDIQSVCDMKKPPKDCAAELMREVLSETNAVKRQRLLSADIRTGIWRTIRRRRRRDVDG